MTASQSHHFETGHLLTNIKGRTISGGLVTFTAQGVQFILNLVSVMVLARLLTPQDFGLVAMVTTITGFLRIFNDAGLSTATVQREGITHAQVSNLFWTNVALGGAVTLLLAAGSPIVAWFYREPRLLGVTLALSLTFLLTSSAVQHLAILKRQMRFRTIAVIQVGSMAAGVAVGIVTAWIGCGYWSLVAMQLTTPIVSLGLTLWQSRWRPQLFKRRSGTRPLLHFGANLSVSTFMWSLARGSDALLIGRRFGSAPLGLYSRAGALLSRPLDQLMSPIEAVFVPTLARLLSQPERYRRIVLQVFDIIVVVTFPFTGMFLALSRPLTLVVLGPKWADAAPIFAGFTLVSLYIPVATIANWLMISQGRGKDFLVLSTIGSTMTLVSFLAGLPFGPVGVARAYSIYCLTFALPVLYYGAGRSGPVKTRDLWGCFLKHLPLWCVVCGATWLARQSTTHFRPGIQLLICGPIGFFSAIAFIWIYPPSRRAVLGFIDAVRHWKKMKESQSA